MNILVCIKQVPGTTSVEVDPVTGVLKRDGVASKMNPYDLFAIEQALCLKERFGGEVAVLTMGPNQAISVAMEAICMGADRGCLVSDRKLAGADVLATSYTLSQGIQKIGKFDLILCGKQTTDGDTAQVGAETAEFLGIDHASNVTEITEVSGGCITVRVNMEHCMQTQEMTLPCLLSMEKDANTPRLPSYRRKLQVDAGLVKVLSVSDFDDQNADHYGLNGSPTSVERIFPPEKNADKQLFRGTAEILTDQLFALLTERKFI